MASSSESRSSGIQTARRGARWRPLGLAAAIALQSIERPAVAAPSTAEVAAAQSLFDEGRRLFDTGHVHEACDNFSRSLALDPRDGTLLDLAICHEKDGRTASAWGEFNEARRRARAEGRTDREAFAGEHLDGLAPRLSYVKLDVSDEARVPGLVIRLCGAPVQEAGWGLDIPVDPGACAVDATAPGHRPWQTLVTIPASAERRILSVAVLAPFPADASGHEQGDALRPLPRSPSTIGLGIAGLAIASLAVGAVFGGEAIGKRHDAESACAAGSCGAGQALNNQGVTFAWISDVALGLGIVGLASSAYLLFVNDRGAKNARTRISLTARGIFLAGSW